MTREEAIRVLEPFKACMFDQHGCPISDAAIALDVAIEALNEQKTGKWIQAEDIPTEYAVCTNCKGHGEFYMNYCWHCGSRMEREEE